MSGTQTRKAQLWLKPKQVESMRTAITNSTTKPLRNETIIQLLYDTGLRVNEARQLNWGMFHLNDSEPYLGLPAEIQKDYPIENSSPEYTQIGLADGTIRLLRTLHASLDPTSKDAVFQSREGGRLTSQQIRNVVRKAACEAEINPQTTSRGMAESNQITPHTLRHSVAYRMLIHEEETIYDVQNRLRHASIQTTDRVYSHLDRV